MVRIYNELRKGNRLKEIKKGIEVYRITKNSGRHPRRVGLICAPPMLYFSMVCMAQGLKFVHLLSNIIIHSHYRFSRERGGNDIRR